MQSYDNQLADGWTKRLVSMRLNAKEDLRSNEGKTLLCMNQTLIHRRIGRELVRGHIRCWKINLHVYEDSREQQQGYTHLLCLHA